MYSKSFMFISDSFFVRNTCQLLQQKVIFITTNGGGESNFDRGVVTRILMLKGI